MNKRKLGVFVVNYQFNVNIDDFDNPYLMTVCIIIKHKSFAKDFVYLYYDNEICVNVILFQCLRNTNI